jgi:curli production assembly/transport component CsgG
MKKIKQKIVLIGLAGLLLTLAGCYAPVQEFATQAPTLTQVPYTHEQLRTLPSPKGKIPVSLYSFRDQTGQYKPLPGVSSFSTAVTQGATSMLIQALKDSGWFLAVEREGLQDLLTERKIIRAALKENGKASKSSVKLPPLEYGHILLEGGITSYETNTVTGGLGARYWGLGGSVEYRQDRVSVHLRAVDIRSGRILKSVSTTKTILSKKVDASLFRFLSFKRLLEIEGGFTTNEPTQLCVAAAIDKAVIALIVEGVVDGLWTLKDPKQMNNQVIQDYLVEAGKSKEKPSIPSDRIKG